MGYKFFSEYVVSPKADLPFTTQEDELVWMVDSEDDGCSIIEKVMAKEFRSHGIKLVSIQLRRNAGELTQWETVKTFPVHKDHGGGGLVIHY